MTLKSVEREIDYVFGWRKLSIRLKEYQDSNVISILKEYAWLVEQSQVLSGILISFSSLYEMFFQTPAT